MKTKHTSSTFNTLFGWLVAAIIMAAIIGGLLIVGGPAKARDQKIDAKRLRNMHMTARVISCYADDNDGAPQAIEPVKAALKKDAIPQGKKPRCRNLKWGTDPVTNIDFEYNRFAEQRFELCGVFAREGDAKSGQTRPIYNATGRDILNTSTRRESGGRFCYAAKNWDEKKS